MPRKERKGDAHMNDQKFMLSPYRAKYNAMRLSLLFVLVFSTINLFSPLLGFYMLFSAYIPQLLSEVGALIFAETGMIIFYIIAIVLALFLLVPYLLCYILSKKRVGFMIGALVLFSVDTVFFLINFVSTLIAGDVSYVIDLIFHVYALVSLAFGVWHGLSLKKEKRPDYEALAAQAENGDSPFDTRALTITRQKSLVGCTMRLTVFVNGKETCDLKNGESKTITVPKSSFALGATYKSAFVSSESVISEGEDDLFYTVVLKSGVSSSELSFVPSANQRI